MKSIYPNSFGQAIATALLMTLAACNLPQTPASQSPVPEKAPTNLVALLFVKKDNLKNELRGEIYPIALLLNDRYLEIGTDLTRDLRDFGNLDAAGRARILSLNNQRVVTNAIQNFTVVSNGQTLGEFQVEKPIISQFSCSSIITGQGNFQSQTSLQAIFDQLPQSRTGGFSGGTQQLDETWRTAIALSQAPEISKPPAPSDADLTRYREAALAFGKTAIAAVANGGAIPGEAVVESVQVVDLDQDGSPEIFSTVKQGNSANSPSRTPTGFAAVWFSDQAGQPQLLETTQASVSLTGSQRFPYELLETIDINGDGVQEAIVQRTGYESTSFEIYEYKNKQLNRVFEGAGYGC
ncbi:MAG: hypothetical protein HY785_00650 [Oscillatoriophycideae cyanobacterium NC_groundwater_1537_Pr4_S-0.65um_50_18]|nr:hypothetical protein [Oscillatoriophycideae cyanobacterium NC_groundwater_1537_Pr4_S-0.65um_50_18]